MPTNTRDIVAKTADYTIIGSDEGALFTNRGASGAVIFTTPAAPPTGFWFEVAVIADQNVTVTTGTADTLITFNDATADTIAWSTAGSLIGSGGKFVYDGTGWISQPYANASNNATPLLARATPTT